MITFRCECGQKLKVKDAAAGHRVKCPNCDQRIAVPEIEQEENTPAFQFNNIKMPLLWGGCLIPLLCCCVFSMLVPPAANRPRPNPLPVEVEQPISAAETLRANLEKTVDLKTFRFDDGFLLIEINRTPTFGVSTMYSEARTVLRLVKESNVDFNTLDILYFSEFVNDFGEESIQKSMLLDFSRETVDRIQFDNFLSSSVPKIADEKWIHPGL